MEQRYSLVTLGTGDLGRARAFYEALGWRSRAGADDDVVFFQTGTSILALWGKEELAEDCGVPLGEGFGGIAVAYNVGSPEEVDEVIAEAERAGATISRAPGKTFWGGYNAVFLDPDGHPWEIAHNPHWTLGSDGSVTLGD
ncbi:MAG TPA: VOC family protein [Solirubrobacteraceae bacterium]|nr:VOC family protein [Solirubrobacteraceae bacterium]